MIEFHNVTKKFGAHVVLDKISFQINPNEMVVLSGPSGSGKSTIVSLLIGAEKPNGGSIEVDGMIVNEMNNETLQLYRRKVGVAFQDYKLLPQKTVYENVAFALEVCEEPDSLIHQRVPIILERVGLLEAQDQFPDQLSGGERQRLTIARALVHLPRLLIADEPTGNLDEPNARAIVELLETLHKEGATVLITTHDPIVRRIAHAAHWKIENGKVTPMDVPLLAH